MTGVVHRIVGEYHDERDDQHYALGTQWWFNSEDPAAVLLRCPQPEGEIRDWLFARSLLLHGLHHAVGRAVFHIEPSTCGTAVQVTASFDSGPARVVFPLPAVREFLAATIELCEIGEFAESGAYADELDYGIDQLLGDE